MKKGNRIRIIVWGSISILLLVFGSLGFVFFESGHGEVGYVMSQTKPLVDVFNNLKSLDPFENVGINIEAKAKKDTIVVTYSTDASNSAFTFYYSDDIGVRLLTLKFNTYEGEIAKNIIAKYMIEAIAVSKNYKEGTLFEKFTMDDFEKTSILQGINISTDNNITTVTLNMDTSILDANIDKSNQIIYITEEQASDILTGLTAGNNITYKKDNLTLHVNMYDTYYSLFIRDTKEIYSKDIYESVKSILKILSNEEAVSYFVKVCPEFNNNNFESDYMKIIYDTSAANAYSEFDDVNKILQINVMLDQKLINNEISSQ